MAFTYACAGNLRKKYNYELKERFQKSNIIKTITKRRPSIDTCDLFLKTILEENPINKRPSRRSGRLDRKTIGKIELLM